MLARMLARDQTLSPHLRGECSNGKGAMRIGDLPPCFIGVCSIPNYASVPIPKFANLCGTL
jgi:hypothetical protein